MRTVLAAVALVVVLMGGAAVAAQEKMPDQSEWQAINSWPIDCSEEGAKDVLGVSANRPGGGALLWFLMGERLPFAIGLYGSDDKVEVFLFDFNRDGVVDLKLNHDQVVERYDANICNVALEVK